LAVGNNSTIGKPFEGLEVTPKYCWQALINGKAFQKPTTLDLAK